MPKISFVTLKHGSVADCLSQIRQDLLPEEIASDSLAQWVMSFDELENQDHQRDFRLDQIDQYDPSNWIRLLCGHLVASILQTQMPFYFASLFHIGRQWQVALFSLESIDDVEQTENLFASARNLVRLSERSQHDVGLSEESSAELIRRMCMLGREEQSRQLNLAREWWGTWKNEVGSYQRAITEFQEYFNSMEQDPYEILRPVMQILARSVQSSSLRGEMQLHGVRFKPQIDAQTPANQQYWWVLVLLALVSGSARYSYSHPDLFEVLVDILRNQRFAPQFEMALWMLKRKYGEEDPFIRYGVGKTTPTPELLELIREHKLPNGNDSPWLRTWKQTLDSEPSRYDKLPIPNTQSGQIQALSVRSADSTIKRNLTKQPNPAESWEGFLQRIFEEEWIQAIGMMAGNTNKEVRSSTLPWDLRKFQRFITDVVAGLNKMGYSLTVPDSTRLMTLLAKARKSKSPYEDITW